MRSKLLDRRQTSTLKGKYQATTTLAVVTYPHHVIREKKFAVGAGADRLSQGMSMTFGKPVGVAARVKEGERVFVLRTTSNNRAIAKEALKRAAKKLSGVYNISLRELKAVQQSTSSNAGEAEQEDQSQQEQAVAS